MPVDDREPEPDPDEPQEEPEPDALRCRRVWFAV
jgi:hypothetical protein